MKPTIGLFGKVILTGLIAVIVVGLLAPNDGVLKQIPKAKATCKTETAKNLVADITSAEQPVITGDAEGVKMKVGVAFDLKDLSKVGLKIGYEDGTDADFEITKIYDQWDNSYDTAKARAFIPPKAGNYYVTYRAYRIYQETELETVKEVKIVAIE